MNAEDLARIVLRALGLTLLVLGTVLALHTAITAARLAASEVDFGDGDSYFVVDTSLPTSLLISGAFMFLLAPALSKWVAK